MVNIGDNNLNPKYKLDIPEECIKSSEKFTEKDWKACVELNEEISKRTTYGIREELANKDGVMLSWSNGSRKWFGSGGKIKKGSVVSMDANELFAPISPSRFERVNDCLGVLPLYFGSTEAQLREEVPRSQAIEIWAKGQIDYMLRKKGV